MRARLEAARAESAALSDRLHEMQTRVEVMGEELERRQDEFVAFLGRLSEAMGVDSLGGESGTLDFLRRLRAKAELVDTLRSVLNGDFSPDLELRKRVACALGVASFSVGDILDRAQVLASVHVKNAEMFRDLVALRAELDELREGE